VTEAACFDDAETAAMLAVLITERGLGSGEIDMEHRLQRLRSERGRRAEQARALAARIARQAGGGRSAEPTAAGRLLLHAYPDRIAKARGQLGHFVLANGRGAVLDPAEPLARSTFLVVAELQGKAQNARILAAATISEADIRTVLADRISTEVETGFDLHRGAVRAREITRLGAIHLSRKPLPSPRGTAADRAILAALRTHGLHLLPWQGRATALRQRLAWLHRVFGNPWPAVDDDTLMARLEEWLLPFLTGEAELAALGCEQLAEALLVRLPPTLRRNLDRLAPSHFLTPTGGRFAIDYGRDEPTLSVRVQELFGLDYHPTIGDGIVPLTLELLSPARRPIQTTRDLPAFWRGSWSEVRAAMRGRYPKHPWPEDPLSAQVTTRDKPRGERVQ
jgi:ATP-dependent helicase HrpB